MDMMAGELNPPPGASPQVNERVEESQQRDVEALVQVRSARYTK